MASGGTETNADDANAQLAENPEWQRLVELANRNADILNDDDDDYNEGDEEAGQAGGGKSKQTSAYFKNYLITMKTYHEVVDEIYSQVSHLEPWEKGSRRTSGQVGMCGGVRGVGAGGVVSSAFCLLFKLFTLHLTRKQLIGLIRNRDSVYIRGLGFMYARYCLPPQDLWYWYGPYIDDEDEIDVKAGGGHTITVGEMLRHFLTKLDWYSTLFPRIPIPVQKKILEQLDEHDRGASHRIYAGVEYAEPEEPAAEAAEPQPAKHSKDDKQMNKPSERSRDKETASYGQMLSKELERHNWLPSPPEKRRSRSRSRERARGARRLDDERRRHGRSRSRDRGHRSRSDSRSRRGHRRSRSRSRHRNRSRSRSGSRHRSGRGYYDSTRRSRHADDERRAMERKAQERREPYKRADLPELTEPELLHDDDDDDYGHVERLLRRASARKAAVQSGNDDDDDLQLLGLGGGARKAAGRPSVFI